MKLIIKIKIVILKILTVLLIFFYSFSGYAGIETLIKNVFPRGTMNNISKSAIVSEQQSGHLIGGSVVAKTPAEPGLQLLNLQSPTCKLGGLPCGAQFEILGGGISIVSSAELVRHLKGLIQNAAAYGGILAIKTLCPQCEDVMGWLDSKADWINSLAKTDCEDMTKLADGMLSKITAGARANRQASAVLSGDGKDQADIARRTKEDKDDPTKTNPELASMLGDNFNLVWKALAKKSTGDEQGNSLKELLMSISGTIIGKKDNNTGRRSTIYKKSLVNKELIEEFIGISSSGSAGKINLYKCNENTQCLNPEISSEALSEKETLIGKIRGLLTSITEKVQKDEGPLTSEEETLAALASLSLITKIELDLKTYANPANVVVAQNEFIEALCYDVITNYLTQLLHEVSAATAELEHVQLADSGIFKKFDTEVRETIRTLAQAKHDAFKRYDLIAATKARMRQEINYFDMRFEEFLSGQNENK